MVTRFRSLIHSALTCSANTAHDVEVVLSNSEGNSYRQSSTSERQLYPERIMRIDQSMDDLPDDILHLVIETMICDHGCSSLKQFSRVSKRARNVSIPYLFRQHCWRPGQDGVDLLPHRFWPYVRSFHLMLDGYLYHRRVAENSVQLAAALPFMTNIAKFRLTGRLLDYRWREIMISVASLPQLSALEFVCSTGHMTPIAPPSRFVTPPTRIVLHFHSYQTMHRPEPLSAIFALCAETVEYFELCEHAVHLNCLTENEWPRLREFVVCGHLHPTGTSIANVLERMPRLRRLDLDFRCRPESTQLVVWTTPISGQLPSPILSELTSLSIADPSNFDDSFDCLPDTLESLSILSTPPLQVLPRHELFRRLGALRSSKLTVLRLVVDGPLDDALFFFINATFPLLEVLGIHRFGAVGNQEQVDEIAANLQPFKRLRLLQLNIGFHADPIVSDPANLVPRNWANKIASHVPWIKEIAVATPLTPFNQHWLTFTVGSHHCKCDTKTGICELHGLVPMYIELPH